MKTFIISLLCLSFHFCQAQTQGNDTALETLGVFGGSALYNYYVAIGLLADSYTGDVYDDEYCKELVDEQISMLNVFKQASNQLLDSGFLTFEDDKRFAREMVACADLLLAEANALNTYLDIYSDENANAFQTSRSNAWDKLAELLGLD